MDRVGGQPLGAGTGCYHLGGLSGLLHSLVYLCQRIYPFIKQTCPVNTGQNHAQNPTAERRQNQPPRNANPKTTQQNKTTTTTTKTPSPNTNQTNKTTQTLPNRNLTSPLVAAPTQTPSKLPCGHASRAAATQRAHRSLDTLMVAPCLRSVASSVNTALPDRPTVSAGAPPHRVARGPAMEPQMAREAAYSS